MCRGCVMDAVTLAYATRATIIALQSINDQMSAVQIRLATGKRVNGAFDNPAAFFTASSLSARAATLQTLLDGVVVAQKTVEAAGKGMTAIQSLLQSAQNQLGSALRQHSGQGDRNVERARHVDRYRHHGGER